MPKNPSTGQPHDRTAPESDTGTAADAGTPEAAPTRPGRTVAERKKQFLVTPRQLPAAMPAILPMGIQPMGMQPLHMAAVEQALRASPDIELVDSVGPKGPTAAALAMGGNGQGVLVARMSEQRAATLRQQGQGWLLVERDHHLRPFDPLLRQPDMVTAVGPASGPALRALVLVLGKDGAPLADAEVMLFGSMVPASGITDADGQVSLTLYGDTPHTVSGLYVKPKYDYWSYYQRDPEISVDEPNVVTLGTLSSWPPLNGLPERNAYGWGQRAMRFDQLPSAFRGAGVRVALVDSGAATGHTNLGHIRAGLDVINRKTSPDTWNVDTLGHGSHCAGIIAGADAASGIRGCVPDAEIHVCKVFPGGQVSDLIEALEYCIEHQVDVVNLSLGMPEPSEALEQQLLRAKRAGVACIAAAGNLPGGPVQYPAASPHVLAVAALGRLGEFPPDSYHTETVGGPVDQQGFFAARFSCAGPQVAVCAPGVGVVSSVPPNNFAAWDGTSMAAPHVAALAALILAHHPEFQGSARVRSAERVDRLFQVIRMSARRIGAGDPARYGTGLPDALAALAAPMMAGQPLGMAPGAQFGSPFGSAFGSPFGTPFVQQPGAPLGAAQSMLVGGQGMGGIDLAAYAGMAPGQPQQRQFIPFGIGPGTLGPGNW